MKNIARRGLIAISITLGAIVATATEPTSAAASTSACAHIASVSGERALGERCSKDCQCESRECKGFKCVPRDYNAHPSLPKGKDCRFDGDCASCDCAAFKCR